MTVFRDYLDSTVDNTDVIYSTDGLIMDNLRLVGGPINVTNNERLIFLPTIGVFQVIRTIVVQIGMDIVRNRGRNNTIVEEAVDVEDIIIEDRLNSTTDSVNKDINIVY